MVVIDFEEQLQPGSFEFTLSRSIRNSMVESPMNGIANVSCRKLPIR